jgi:hypothetical protein
MGWPSPPAVKPVNALLAFAVAPEPFGAQIGFDHLQCTRSGQCQVMGVPAMDVHLGSRNSAAAQHRRSDAWGVRTKTELVT